MKGEKTIGEIAKEKGFDNVLDFFKSIKNKRDSLTTLEVGDEIVLPKDYTPTHFKTERILPTNSELIVSEVGYVNIFCHYQIKIVGYDNWFSGNLFKAL